MTNYDSYETGGSTDDDDYDDDDVELRIAPYTTVEATVDRVFGAETDFQQSLGLNLDDVELVDGALYLQPEGGYVKAFSWEEVTGFTPKAAAERDRDPTADDADEIVTRNYFGDTYTYELIAARVPEVTDSDGTVLVEPTSRTRDFEAPEDGGTPEFGEWEDLGGDQPAIGNTISWYNGSAEYGASNTAKVLAELLTEYGENAVLGEGNDIQEWLVDSSTQDITREEVQGRRVQFFVVRRDGDNHTYNLPIMEDVDTGKRIYPDAGDGGDEGNADSGDSDALVQAKEMDTGTYPEPVAEFISSGDGLQLTEDRARDLLQSMIENDETPLTEEMVEDNGGREALVEQVV